MIHLTSDQLEMHSCFWKTVVIIPANDSVAVG